MRRTRNGIAMLAAVGLTGLMSGSADAHFTLESPPAATTQDAQGSPQKTAPCGPNGAGTPTGVVTTYQAGETITITIDEQISHPGHYRVALAVNDPSELPAAPPVTPGGGDECDSTVIQSPPVFPILADGMLPHTASFGGVPQSFEVTLPDDVTCDNCTLQVIEYMSSHNAPCFYYHCANIAIQTEPVMTTAATTSTGSGTGGASSGNGGSTASTASSGTGGSGGNAGGVNPTFGETDEGCTCSVVGARSELGMLAFFGFGGLLFAAGRRRRRDQ